MRKIILVAASMMLCFGFLKAEENETKVKSDLKEVKIFLRGASLTSKGNFQLESGAQELVFENLSPTIDVNSIQAKGEGDFTILAVAFRKNFLANQPKSKEIISLEDSVENIQLRIETQKNLRGVYEAEESFLLANKNIGGANTGVSSVELEKIANLLRTRLPDLKSKVQECKLKEKRLGEDLTKVNAQLLELNAKRNKNTGEIIVSVHSRSNASGKMTLTYSVPNASWTPIYDVRAISEGKDVKLDYRASITQNTGMDWKNVKLSLSTGNPSESGIQPILNPWWLSFYTNRKAAYGGAAAPTSAYGQKSQSLKLEESYQDIVAESAADNSSDYTEVTEGQMNFTYEISIPYTILSDNKAHSVNVQSYTIPATFRYFAIPKLDQDAFLLARITDWEKYNLLSGKLNIFFDDNLVGNSYLDTRSTGDTLNISLGRDKNVVVKRNILQDFCEKKIIGMNKKETRTYEISLRNKKSQNIEIEILDQIPLSRVSEIEVEANELSGGQLDKETGKVSWNFVLKSGEEKKFRIGFTAKFPKDKSLSNW